jgi:hypothetical protein
MSDTLFDMYELDWREHYDGMPEYEHEGYVDPEVTIKFKFRDEESFARFMDVVKRELYDGCRVVDGNQKKGEYQAWYPMPPRPSSFEWVKE